MAITKTSEIVQITYDASIEKEGNITAHFKHIIDDEKDADLPVVTYSEKVYSRYFNEEDSEGNVTKKSTDMSKVDAVVKAVADAVWT